MATALQLIGLTAISVGVLLFSIPLGLVVAGALITAIGYSLGRS